MGCSGHIDFLPRRLLYSYVSDFYRGIALFYKIRRYGEELSGLVYDDTPTVRMRQILTDEILMLE